MFDEPTRLSNWFPTNSGTGEPVPATLREGRRPLVGRPEPIRDAIEQCRSRPLERRFEMGVVNRHGPTVRSPLAGGDQERELTAYFRDQARRFEISWDRKAGLLDRIAKNCKDDARRHDEWTEQQEV